jgi:hypothetical protein
VTGEVDGDAEETFAQAGRDAAPVLRVPHEAVQEEHGLAFRVSGEGVVQARQGMFSPWAGLRNPF